MSQVMKPIKLRIMHENVEYSCVTRQVEHISAEIVRCPYCSGNHGKKARSTYRKNAIYKHLRKYHSLEILRENNKIKPHTLPEFLGQEEPPFPHQQSDNMPSTLPLSQIRRNLITWAARNAIPIQAMCDPWLKNLFPPEMQHEVEFTPYTFKRDLRILSDWITENNYRNLKDQAVSILVDSGAQWSNNYAAIVGYTPQGQHFLGLHPIQGNKEVHYRPLYQDVSQKIAIHKGTVIGSCSDNAGGVKNALERTEIPSGEENETRTVVRVPCVLHTSELGLNLLYKESSAFRQARSDVEFLTDGLRGRKEKHVKRKEEFRRLTGYTGKIPKIMDIKWGTLCEAFEFVDRFIPVLKGRPGFELWSVVNDHVIHAFAGCLSVYNRYFLHTEMENRTYAEALLAFDQLQYSIEDVKMDVPPEYHSLVDHFINSIHHKLAEKKDEAQMCAIKVLMPQGLKKWQQQYATEPIPEWSNSTVTSQKGIEALKNLDELTEGMASLGRIYGFDESKIKHSFDLYLRGELQVNFSDEKPWTAWGRAYVRAIRSEHKDFMMLASYLIQLPASEAICERVHSVAKRFVPEHRKTLGQRVLCDFVNIAFSLQCASRRQQH